MEGSGNHGRATKAVDVADVGSEACMTMQTTDHGSATARAPPAARMGRLAGGLQRAQGRSAGWDSLVAGQLGAVNAGVQWHRRRPTALNAFELLRDPPQGGPAAKSPSDTALRSVSPVP